MRARRILGAIALGLAAVSTVHADDFAAELVKSATDIERPPSLDALHDYLLAQADQAFALRRDAIAAIKTPEDVGRRQKALKAFLLESLGDLPARTPLNPRVIATLPRQGYRVEKIIFESRPGHHVTANFYLPEANSPLPGVLVPCGHSENGKAYADYQRICILLAKNGMAALCYDPIGQGERNQLLDAKGAPVVRNTNEHTMAGIGALLVDRQLASYRIWDGMRALDYLASRPEIDPKRLGCTGNSGGGTLTAYLMALDDRIGVAAPSCYITSLKRLFATIGPQDAEQNITGQVAAGLDHADYLTLRAPRPTLMTVGTRDFFDINGSWDSFREAKLIYGRLGFGEHVEIFESDEEHGFTKPRRVATARWMKRWLLKQDEAVDEPSFPLASDAELQCTRTGQVLSELKGVSVFDLNRAREEELRAARANAGNRPTAAEFRSLVKQRLGLANREMKPVAPQIVRQENHVRSLKFEIAPGFALNALDVGPASQAAADATLVYAGFDQGKQIRELTTAILHPERRMVLVDLIGMPRPVPKAGSNRQESESPFGRDWKEGYIALHLGRPLLGERVTHLLRILEGLAAEPGSTKHTGFHLVGEGAAGLVLLHAALLDEHGLIKMVTVERSLVSWANVVQSGTSRAQLASVVPGVLEAYDLPELAARLAPLPLSILAPTDAMGTAVSQELLAQAYAVCARAYGPQGALVLKAGQGLTPSR